MVDSASDSQAQGSGDAEAKPKVDDGAAADGSDSEDVRGKELMPYDDGSLSAEKGQSSAIGLVLNYAEPQYAAGTAVFGLNLLVLPLLAKLNSFSAEEDGLDGKRGPFAYDQHSEYNSKQKLRLFTQKELVERLGLLDAAFIVRDITKTTDEVDDHIEACDAGIIDDEVSAMQKWRDRANNQLRSLQKRSALAFLGLPPDSSDTEINKMYKKMALELHPDKGGDPEKFQELQEMKERLTELEKEEGEAKKMEKDEEEDEELKKAKEKEKEEEKKEEEKLPIEERIKKLRMDVHENALKVWQRAQKSREEITGEKSLKANAAPSLQILRQFVDRFVAMEVKTLRHDDAKGAEVKFRKFVKQGAEILAVAALCDVQSTLSTVAINFNYKIVARSGSSEIKQKCTNLLEAISDVPVQVDALLKHVEDGLASAKERALVQTEENRKEMERKARASGQKEGEVTGQPKPKGPPEAKKPEGPAPDAKIDGEEHFNTAAPKISPAGVPKNVPKSIPKGEPAPKAAATAAKSSSAPAPKKADPFEGFDFSAPPRGPASPSKASEPAKVPSTEIRKVEESKESALSAQAPKEKRTCWDPNFDHPYAGALKSNGTGIYCRPCQRWIMTYDFNVAVFNTHVERVHPTPPPGWKI